VIITDQPKYLPLSSSRIFEPQRILLESLRLSVSPKIDAKIKYGFTHLGSSTNILESAEFAQEPIPKERLKTEEDQQPVKTAKTRDPVRISRFGTREIFVNPIPSQQSMYCSQLIDIEKFKCSNQKESQAIIKRYKPDTKDSSSKPVTIDSSHKSTFDIKPFMRERNATILVS
jgi:hypothetical protein